MSPGVSAKRPQGNYFFFHGRRWSAVVNRGQRLRCETDRLQCVTPAMAIRTLLIVSDDTQLPDDVVRPLRQKGLQVVCASSGKEAVQLAQSHEPEFVLLDDPLADTDSLELSWEIRSRLQDEEAPLFWITRRYNGQSGGAVDFADRLASFINRAASPQMAEETIELLGLIIDPRRHRATIDGHSLDLTPTEFRLLLALASKPGFVLPREQLAIDCMKSGYAGNERTIDAHIKSIRRKLGDRADLVETVRGIGYRFREQ